MARRRTGQRVRRVEAVDSYADEKTRRPGHRLRPYDQEGYRARGAGRVRDGIAAPTRYEISNGFLQNGRQAVRQASMQSRQRDATLVLRRPSEHDLQLLVEH